MDTNYNEAMIGSIPALSAGDAIEYISNGYIGFINRKKGSKAEMSKRKEKAPCVMLWGQPGVGKSELIKEVVNSVAEKTKKKGSITDVRLVLFNPIDLRGIPVVDREREFAIWLRPKILDMNTSDDVINLLFLDEITSASLEVQKAAYQLTLEREIGEHKLPDNCIVAAAGNRPSDKSATKLTPYALSNRMTHFEIVSDIESWRKWAIENDIDERIIGFLTFKPDRLNTFNPQLPDPAFCTPRTWEMVDYHIKNHGGDMEDSSLMAWIGGTVGAGVAAEFKTWTKIYNQLPDIRAIFSGQEFNVPKDTDAIYALISSMAKYASEHRDETESIANSIRYAQKLPPDFAMVLLKDYMYIERDYKLKLMKIPEFSKWLKTYGILLNGIT